MARAKPRELKELQGTINVTKDGKENPLKPEYGFISPPDFLSEEAKSCWDTIAPMLDRMHVIAHSDSIGMMLLCDTLAEYITLTKQVNEFDSSTYESKARSGEIVFKLRPEVRRKKELFELILKLLDRYGMTPSSRSKLEVAPAGDGDGDEFDSFMNELEPRKH